jgi:hypothetical protein
MGCLLAMTEPGEVRTVHRTLLTAGIWIIEVTERRPGPSCGPIT